MDHEDYWLLTSNWVDPTVVSPAATWINEAEFWCSYRDQTDHMGNVFIAFSSVVWSKASLLQRSLLNFIIYFDNINFNYKKRSRRIYV